MVKTSTELAGMLGPMLREPYAISGGHTISHFEPTFMSCMASVHPLITCWGLRAEGDQRDKNTGDLREGGGLPALV